MRLLAALLLFFAACGGGGGVPALTIFAPLVANEARPIIQWAPLNPGSTYVVRVWADEARTQLIEEQTVNVPGLRMATVLADGQRVWVDVTAGGRTGSAWFRVLLLPESFPEFTLARSGPGQQGGYKLFNLLDISPPDGEDRVGAMVLVNDRAEVVWYYVHPTRGILTDPRVIDNGNITFIVRDNEDPDDVTSPGFEIDWDGNIVWQSRPGALLHHELAPGPGGQRLYMTFLAQEYQGTSYESDGLELVDPATNEVLWSWSMFDHYSPADFPDIPEAENIGLSRLGVDWSHSNSAAWDPARSLIWMSIRHFDRIIGIEYPSGDIRVVVGDGGLGPPGYMSHQHAPEVQANGDILFWDNGNSSGVSKAKMFSLDEAAGRVTPVFEWGDSPPIFDFAVGDADRQPNGNFLVTAGISRRVIEVDSRGNIVWELALVTDRHWIYRTQQVPNELVPPELMR